MTLWQELAKTGGLHPPHPASIAPSPLEPSRMEDISGGFTSWKDDVKDISRVLDDLQTRLDGLRAALKEVQAQAQPQDQPQGSLSDLD